MVPVRWAGYKILKQLQRLHAYQIIRFRLGQPGELFPTLHSIQIVVPSANLAGLVYSLDIADNKPTGDTSKANSFVHVTRPNFRFT